MKIGYVDPYWGYCRFIVQDINTCFLTWYYTAELSYPPKELTRVISYEEDELSTQIKNRFVYLFEKYFPEQEK